ncbi:MAG: efflux RND transporter periplasmic adaptor subunit [Smithellaceae bacterium]|nr:efflux RND transporter periplasmic adaptor subunit [Smithellaceae bacterium]
MRRFFRNTRIIALVAAMAPLLAVFLYVAVRSGPFAPVSVTVTRVESQPVSVSLFGIGRVEARYSYRIGPTAAGRVKQVYAQVGDRVGAGQLLAEMDPVDLDERVAAQEAAIKRAEAQVLSAKAQVQDSSVRAAFAESQVRRYTQLLQIRSVSEETLAGKRQESQVAQAGLAAMNANLDAAEQELARLRADRGAIVQQRANLLLRAPVKGLVVARDAEPGTAVAGGQKVLEVVDPVSIWINVRFDQSRASGLRAGLPAIILLRSQTQERITGRVARVEPLADAVTEEVLAKVIFDQLPALLPPIGELAEVTLSLPELAAAPVIPNASLKRLAGKSGVWLVEKEKLKFAPVRVGASDLDGRVQILEGLKAGDRVVVYSQRELQERSRIKIVDRLTEVAP